MAGFDTTRAQGFLRRIYNKKMNEVLYSFDNAKLNPGFVSLKRGQGKKVTTPFGEAYVVALKSKRVSSSSASYSVSETISQASDEGAAPKADQFLLTPSKYYTVHQVDADVLERCTEEGAYIDAASEVVQDAIKAHMRRLCIHSHGTGSAKVGTITAITTTAFTVATSEARNFERGDRLVAAAAEATGGLRSATSIRVTTRSSTTGVFGTSADATALGWQVGDSLFFEGDRNAVFKGYFAWAPDASHAPAGGESFFGVDRSVDTRLYGLAYNATGKDISQALIEAAYFAAGEGAMISRVRLSFQEFGTLIQERDDLKTIELSAQEGTIGFKGLQFPSPVGIFAIVPDESVPANHALMEVEDDWNLLTIFDQMAEVVQHDGLILRKVSGSDAYACYIKSQIQPWCAAPGHQVHMYNVGA